MWVQEMYGKSFLLPFNCSETVVLIKKEGRERGRETKQSKVFIPGLKAVKIFLSIYVIL